MEEWKKAYPSPKDLAAFSVGARNQGTKEEKSPPLPPAQQEKDGKEEEKEKDGEKKGTITIVKSLGRVAESAATPKSGSRVLSDVIWKINQPPQEAAVYKFREDGEIIDFQQLDLYSLVWRFDGLDREKKFITVRVPTCPHERFNSLEQRKSMSKRLCIFRDAMGGVTATNLLTELFLFYTSTITPEDEVEIATMDDQCVCRKYFQELSRAGPVTYGALLCEWIYLVHLRRTPSSGEVWSLLLTIMPPKRSLQNPKSKGWISVDSPDSKHFRGW